MLIYVFLKPIQQEDNVEQVEATAQTICGRNLTVGFRNGPGRSPLRNGDLTLGIAFLEFEPGGVCYPGQLPDHVV
jgi:hypothetical protein